MKERVVMKIPMYPATFNGKRESETKLCSASLASFQTL
jgi:hypothetical protein